MRNSKIGKCGECGEELAMGEILPHMKIHESWCGCPKCDMERASSQE